MKTSLAIPLVFLAISVWGQEPTFMDAATHPGRNQFYSRLLLAIGEDKVGGQTVREGLAVLKLAYGVRADLALLADVEFRDIDSGLLDERGFSQAVLRVKYRFLKRDLGPLDTWRASVFGGVGLPGGNRDIARKHPFPTLGVATTAILGRHGLNGQFAWAGYGGEPDEFSVNASHLYRLSPARYTAETRGAWYTMVESLNDMDSHGNSRHDVAVGLLYEARRWAWETSLRLPVARNAPRETKYQAVMGWRLLF